MNTTKHFSFPYFVEYIDENGVSCSETWSQATLDSELRAGNVTITHIELAYSAQVALGMAEDD